MTKRFFTADTHLGHLLVSQIRGFGSVEEHNEAVIRNWNEEVSADDQVFLAGDAVLGVRRLTLPLFSRMNGQKTLIAGNHDDCWPGRSNASSRMHLYREYFSNIQPFLRVDINGQVVLISHFPYVNDRTVPPRFMQYRLRDEGNWLLHGHTHSTTRQTSPREIHVGLDAWGLRPVSDSRIIGMMKRQLEREKANAANAASGGAPDAATTDDIPAQPFAED